MVLLSIILVLVYFVLAGIHFNWAVGGKWGFDGALPTKENGEKILNPTKLESAIVGIGLSLFGLFYLVQMNTFNLNLPSWVFSYGGWIIPSIFILRAIGEFRYVGFSKKVKDTTFGRLDTKVYAPLCLGMGIIGFIIQLL